MLNVLIVALGGAAGSVLRYLITIFPVSQKNGFPLKTFLINVLGSFVIGLVAALASKNISNPKMTLFLKVGLCGGFTTFSSFALETEGLIEKGNAGTAFLYVALSILCGLAAVFAAEKIIN